MTSISTNLRADEIARIKKHGNRTSSFLSFYPHFSSFQNDVIDGELRFIEKKNVIAIANEPLSHYSDRAKLCEEFANLKQNTKKNKLIFPISQYLALDLEKLGWTIWQIGSEPIFNLSEYFSSEVDPLFSLPIARNLKRRGAKVSELTSCEIKLSYLEIQAMKEDWLSTKKLAPLEFLNIVDPFEFEDFKRYFALTDKGKMMAILTATPIFFNDQIIGYFFNDIFKKNEARSATTELLIVEAMRVLFLEGVIEVRLGMCPLAQIDLKQKNAKMLNWIFENWKWGYQFHSLYQFKSKLNPTKWRPLYLAADHSYFWLMAKNVFFIHLSAGFFKKFIERSWYSVRGHLELLPKFQIANMNDKKKEFGLRSIRWTLSFFSFFIGLHVLKENSVIAKAWFDSSAYIPGKMTWSGLFIGPLFHNHLPHLLGDQLSFIIFAGALELAFGITFLFWIMALGLWLSNPLTHAFLAVTLKMADAGLWEKVLIEKDYGSSNAVFALVGASLFVLKNKAWLFWPFFLHAIFICIQRESFLAIHHFMGIFLGYLGAFSFFHKDISEFNKLH